MEQAHLATLMAAFDRGSAAFPGLSLDRQRFVERARALAVAVDDLSARAEDLFLAFACAEGIVSALRIFDERHMSQVGLYVARFHLKTDLLDEVYQRLRIRQLVGPRPGISRYTGRGPLGAWLRISAVRIAHDVLNEAGSLPVTLDVGVMDLFHASEDNTDIAIAKERFRGQFARALEEEVSRLDARERTLLRLHFVDGLGLEGIARLYRVHRATVARWYVAIRTKLYEGVRGRVAVDLDVSTAEVRSMVRLLRSEIHLSACRILAAPINENAAPLR